MRQSRITYQSHRWSHFENREVSCVAEDINWYCRDTNCAGKDQMAHEG
ncbi:MAG: hypothetical protein WC389_20535 [Lutibacter sp.]